MSISTTIAAGNVPPELYTRFFHQVEGLAMFFIAPSGQVASWNPAAAAMTGHSAEEAIGKHVSFLFPPPLAPSTSAPSTSRQFGDQNSTQEGWRLRKDGRMFWAHETTTPLHGDHGQLLGFARVLQDQTARKQMETDLKLRAESFADVNRELEAFAHTVAHDLRAPIRAVEQLSAIVLEDRPELEGGAKEDIRAIHASAKRMGTLVQALFELSLSSRRTPERLPVDLSALARDLSKEIQEREPERDLTFDIQDAMVAQADPDMARIVLTNLLTNAVKFTREIAAPRIQVGAEESEHGRAFFVRDNGAGFDPARRGELFQAFSRLHSTGRFEGMGIGLSTVARIVARHGGRTWAQGKEGAGATFWFTLPAQ